MLAKHPFDLKEILNKENVNKEILRYALLAELDAISLYEQFAEMTDDENIKKVMLDVAREEKEHVGEFQTMLLRLDKEQVEKMKDGKEEVEEMTSE